MKRAIDLVVAAGALACTSPVQFVAALMIWLESGRPILFAQPRAGLHGRVFTALKFRSMRLHAPDLVQVTGAHPLVTRTGRVIRRLKIDELPQLVNVVRGDMSLVGPRPTLPELAAQYSEYERRRLAVRPGLTGWAQVNGNVTLTWSERILLDVWYVDHRTARLDLAILLRTVMVVIRGERTRPAALEAARQHAGLARQAG